MDQILDALRGAGEPTRLRILAALRRGELTVSELTQILAQSQPRISRHLKLMSDAKLIERRREGSWAFFRLQRDGFAGELARFALDAVRSDDPVLQRDQERLERVRQRRAEIAEAYFRDNAAEWDRLRALHAAETAVEDAARAMLAPATGKRFARLLDLGAGTGRMLEVFAERYERAVGYDVNQQMLGFARSRLDRARLTHAELRQEDILALPEPDAGADAAILHQVLHFLAEPALALSEAARTLQPGGQLLVVDFAPHDAEFLREQHAHRRLGFAAEEIERMAATVGLEPREHRDIPAPADMGKHGLTVSLWLFEKSHKGSR